MVIKRTLNKIKTNKKDAFARYQDKLQIQLQEDHVELKEIELDIADFNDFVKKADYEKFSQYGSRAHPQKQLDHYLGAKILDLGPHDIYIDVASSRFSPAAEIYETFLGCKVYRQDLTFREGIHDNLIGGNANAMPVPDGFATKMGLHSSLEHFEGDFDMGFIREVSRVLRKGGRMCSVPLFLADHYMIKTDPAAWPKEGIRFDGDALIHKHEGWNCAFGRFYDIPHLRSRLIENARGLAFTVYVINGLEELDPACRDRKFVAVFDKV